MLWVGIIIISHEIRIPDEPTSKKMIHVTCGFRNKEHMSHHFMDTLRKSNMEYHGIPKLATVIAKGTCSSSNLRFSKIHNGTPQRLVVWVDGSPFL